MDGAAARMLSLFLLGMCIPAVLSSDHRYSRNLTVMTYNTHLAGPLDVQTSGQRMQALNDSIRNDRLWENTDVVCLQGVRHYEDLQAVSAAARAAGFAHQHNFLKTFQKSLRTPDKDGCFRDNHKGARNLMECFLGYGPGERTGNHCRSAPYNESDARFSACLLNACPPQEIGISQRCVECFMDPRDWSRKDFGRVGYTPAYIARETSPFYDLYSKCGLPFWFPDPFTPSWKYMPTLGLILASRLPLTDLEAVRFKGKEASAQMRGYLKATVSTIFTTASFSTFQLPVCLFFFFFFWKEYDDCLSWLSFCQNDNDHFLY